MKELYKVQEVADILGIQRNTLYKWIREGKIAATRYGYKTIRISQSQLDDFLKNKKHSQ